jgi:hypothetical protein
MITGGVVQRPEPSAVLPMSRAPNQDRVLELLMVVRRCKEPPRRPRCEARIVVLNGVFEFYETGGSPEEIV